MSMTKEVFREKIESGETVKWGRFSCQRWEQDYYFSGEETEVFKTWEEFWDRVSGYVLYSNLSEEIN